MLTNQLMPNLSVNMPNRSFHGALMSGITTDPPSDSFSLEFGSGVVGEGADGQITADRSLIELHCFPRVVAEAEIRGETDSGHRCLLLVFGVPRSLTGTGIPPAHRPDPISPPL